MTSPQVGVVLVTHNSAYSIGRTLQSIIDQSLHPSSVVVVDDGSRDATREVVRDWTRDANSVGIKVEVHSASSTTSDTWTRIAQNFTQGVRQLAAMDFVALGDHDDVWLPDRLLIQSQLLEANPSVVLVANNGLVDESALTLFDAFAVPGEVAGLSQRDLLRLVLRRSVVTGGTSMLRPEEFASRSAFLPPNGWLHDRWWGMVAAARGGLLVSSIPVVQYQTSTDQVVGLDRGRQDMAGSKRWAAFRFSDLRRVQAIRGLRSDAAPELRSEFAWGRLVRTLS